LSVLNTLAGVSSINVRLKKCHRPLQLSFGESKSKSRSFISRFKQLNHLRTALQYSPCSLDPMPLPQYDTFSMKALARCQLYCLANRGTLGVNNLPRVVARIMPRWGSNPRPLDHESNALPLHYRATLWDIGCTPLWIIAPNLIITGFLLTSLLSPTSKCH